MGNFREIFILWCFGLLFFHKEKLPGRVFVLLSIYNKGNNCCRGHTFVTKIVAEIVKQDIPKIVITKTPQNSKESGKCHHKRTQIKLI